MWGQTDLEDPEPVSAFDDHQSCKRTLDHKLAHWREQDPEFVIVRDTTVHVLWVRTETAWWSTTAIRYVCLPDTVDPRGPKGK